MPKVGITDTILRDGPQSQAATRMKYSQMEPAFEKLNRVGYYSLECWGGATFDSCLRFLNEDPWERLRKLRKGLPNTKLQMLLRGQNILGYKHYADDVVDFFVKKSIENGIDIIRCFDALNDLRNMQTAVKATKKYGGTAEVAMSYTISPVHTEDYFVRLAAEIAKIMGVEEAPQQVRNVATVVCQGTLDRCKTKFQYHGIKDCVAATLVNDGNRACQYACLGLGTCVRACKFDAIHIDEHSGIAKVDPEKCQSCGACVKACPKHVLSLQPETVPCLLYTSPSPRD